MTERYFDPQRKSLVYIDKEPNESFWDEQWARLAKNTYKNPPNNKYISYLTKKFLPLKSKVLEGGCGLGDKVHSLDKAGFDAFGIDFAPNVVSMINDNWPHLDVRQGDVRKLPFEDNFFDGYWSFGVIEHFFNGYDEILEEMARVIRPGGYLFLTFPMMNAIRRSRAKKNEFPLFNEARDVENFYQFALDKSGVKERFAAAGFKLRYETGFSSLKTIREECSVVGKLANLIMRLPMGLGGKFGIIFDHFMGKYFGHSSVMILERIKS